MTRRMKIERAMFQMFLYWLFLAPKTRKEIKLIQDFVLKEQEKP